MCIRDRFDTTNLNKRLRWWNCGDYYFFEPKQNRILTDDTRTPLDELLETACNMGFIEDDILMLLEEGFCEAVSYTHLDVYKRQKHRYPAICFSLSSQRSSIYLNILFLSY